MILKDFGRDRCVFEGFGRLSEDVVGRAKLTFRSLSFTFVRCVFQGLEAWARLCFLSFLSAEHNFLDLVMLLPNFLELDAAS